MVSIQQLYGIVEEDRKKLLSFFSKVPRKHFHYTQTEKTWSPVQTFRHLLMNIQWMLDKLPIESQKPSQLAIDLEEEVNNQVALAYLIDEFDLISPFLSKSLSSLTSEQEEEYIDMYKGKMQRRIYLIRLINHEHRHLGQIQWLLKRSTGWTDKEIYGIDD